MAGAYLLVLSRHERGARRFVRLPDATVLGWFRCNWTRGPDERDRELRGSIYGLDSVFDEATTAAPRSDAELVAEIARSLYAEGGHEVRAHFIAVQTDDDEHPIHYYFFDDDFLAEPGAWDELPDWRTGTALAVIGDDEDDDDDDDEEEDDDRPGAFERFYRERSRR